MMQNAIVIQTEDLENLIISIIEKRYPYLNQPPKKEEEYISRAQAAKFLKITLPTLGEWVKAGKVPAYRIGSRIRFKKSDVESSLKRVR